MGGVIFFALIMGIYTGIAVGLFFGLRAAAAVTATDDDDDNEDAFGIRPLMVSG